LVYCGSTGHDVNGKTDTIGNLYFNGTNTAGGLRNTAGGGNLTIGTLTFVAMEALGIPDIYKFLLPLAAFGLGLAYVYLSVRRISDNAHLALVSEQPLGERGTPHIDRLDARLPVCRRFGEQRSKPAIEHEQTIARGILSDTVQLLDHLRDDSRGVFVLTALDQRDEFVTCGIFHQVRAFVVPQEAHRPTTIKIAQRPRATLLLRL
jgi:hypothetical protein